ncbi:MAG TPA: hypothetical protein VJ867_15095 [Gemmatimonadaceae bacterium]|nr:hypothetical protein [Gemmatimonadaceae bacterium]
MKRTFIGCVVVLLACGDFNLVPRSKYAAPSVQINFYVDQRIAESTYGVTVGFFPGLDSLTGQPYTIADSSMHIGDSVVMYTRVIEAQPLRSLEYDWMLVRDSSQPPLDTLAIRLPVLASAASGNHVVRLALPTRGDPPVVDLADDVALHVLRYAVDSSVADSTQSFWQLELQKKCFDSQTFLSMSATSTFPDQLRVPRSWLPATTTDSAMACLYSSTTFRARDAAIRTSVYRQANVQWVLRLP